VIMALLFLTLCALPVAAQTPTPWPTPIVTNEYIIRQEVTYGDGGIIVGLLFVGGLLLLSIWLNLSEKVTER